MATAKSLDHSLTSLSNEISTKVAELTNLLNAGSHPIPSLKADSPTGYPNDGQISAARNAIIDAASTLGNLAMGPHEFIFNEILCPKSEAAVLQCLFNFDIFNVVPLEGSISYSEIASKSGLTQDKTERVIKAAMTSRMFYEPEPGKVAHTANSIMPAKNPSLNALIGTSENSGPALVKLPVALKKFGDSGETNETAINLALGKTPEDNYWSILEDDGEGDQKGWRMKLFGKAMAGIRSSVVSRNLPDVTVFDWKSLQEAVVVDVGGGGGHVCIPLATFFPKLKCIVQDVPSQESVFNSKVPTELRSRISYQIHDFFTPQPVKGADIYLLSSCLHDWSDKKAAEILRQLVPAMTPHSRIFILDGVVGEFGEVSNIQMRKMRSTDLLMLSILNGKERTKENWNTLVGSSDPKLVIKQIKQTAPGSPRHLIEIGLRGGQGQ